PAHITRSIPAPATTEPATSAPPLPRNPAEALEACRLATQFHQAGNYEKALQEYTRAIRNDPGLTRAHFNLGLLYRTRQDLQAARTSFETVLKLSPAMTDARYMLALVMTEQGKDDEAVKQLTTIIGKNPDHADAHLALGLLYKKDKSKVSLARKELSIYLKLQPDSLKSKDIRNWLKYQ
ncbi:MAG: tetratricopeptide repeat protein, partial [bacterium]